MEAAKKRWGGGGKGLAIKEKITFLGDFFFYLLKKVPTAIGVGGGALIALPLPFCGFPYTLI